MSHHRWMLACGIAATLIPVAGLSADTPLPVVDGKVVVAAVNGVPITLDAFAEALSRAHQDVERPEGLVKRRDPIALLDRLIGIELVVQEAENIGLDELPRVRDGMESYRVKALRLLLLGRQAQQVTAPDEQRVKRLYRERVKEVRLASIVVASEQAAQEARARILAGEDFAQLARDAVAGGTANPNDAESWTRAKDLRPDVREAVDQLERGQVSPVLRLPDKFALVELLDTRFPDDPDLLEETRATVLKLQQDDALRKYAEELRERYTEVDETLFEGLDYTAEGPGLEAMRADQRVVAEVKGGEPVTVADLTEALAQRAFHGAGRAIEQGTLDSRKHPILEDLLEKRAIDLEAARLGLAETAEYRAMVEKHRRELLFSAFLERAVDSTLKADEPELRRYLAEHVDEFSTPEMVRLESVAFSRREDAEVALDKLHHGADFEWLRSNAAGRMPPAEVPDPLRFDGKLPIVTTALPDALGQALAGVRPGDVRFYAAEGGTSLVLLVRDVVPAQPQPFETARGTLRKRVLARKRQEAFDAWIAELREASEVEVYGSGETMLRALGMDLGKSD